MRIAVFSTQSYDRTFLDEANADSRHELVYLQPNLNPYTMALGEGYPVICVFVNDVLDATVLRHLATHGLKLVALRCAGFNNVDLDTAAELGIKVVRVPAYSPHAVAEHALALILTLNRKTHKAYNRVREGNFSLERLEGFDLYGRTVGVIGTGKIGQVFCRIMQGLGCQVLAYDKYPAEALAAQGVRYASLPELLHASDIISLHCPLTPETHHIINAEALAQMKPGAMLINTSRGALIDTQAVVAALKSRKLGYLGIDVYEQEEALFFQDLSEQVIEDDTISRLMSFSNVLITAHQAFFTRNALEQIATVTMGNIDAFVAGKALAFEVGRD
ncbi:MAG: 2-hydroxyacid dehydrogenase [Bacteroidetes bacterium]|nr:MAG: 2-hydroxyacid dehydrogenase [Bacteroidota bacterium]